MGSYESNSENARQMLGRVAEMAFDHTQKYGLSIRDKLALEFVYTIFMRLLSILVVAELDCRPYPALHGWVEDASELIEEMRGEGVTEVDS